MSTSTSNTFKESQNFKIFKTAAVGFVCLLPILQALSDMGNSCSSNAAIVNAAEFVLKEFVDMPWLTKIFRAITSPGSCNRPNDATDENTIKDYMRCTMSTEQRTSSTVIFILIMTAFIMSIFFALRGVIKLRHVVKTRNSMNYMSTNVNVNGVGQTYSGIMGANQIYATKLNRNAKAMIANARAEELMAEARTKALIARANEKRAERACDQPNDFIVDNLTNDCQQPTANQQTLNPWDKLDFCNKRV